LNSPEPILTFIFVLAVLPLPLSYTRIVIPLMSVVQSGFSLILAKVSFKVLESPFIVISLLSYSSVEASSLAIS